MGYLQLVGGEYLTLTLNYTNLEFISYFLNDQTFLQRYICLDS
jgi:hypothetical protein